MNAQLVQHGGALIIEDANVPDTTEYCRIGFERGQDDPGGQNYDCQEQWAMLLHVPDAAPTGVPKVTLALLGVGA